MSAAIPSLRLYAFMEWIEATSEDFSAIEKMFVCSLRVLRNTIYIFLFHVCKNYNFCLVSLPVLYV